MSAGDSKRIGPEHGGGSGSPVPLEILEAALPNLLRPGRPTGESTPEAALRPLEVAVALAVSAHGHRNCPHLPPPLRALGGMKERTLTTADSLRRMRGALWAHREHEFIQRVVESWLGNHSDSLTTAWGTCPEGVSFLEVIEAARSDPARLAELASALWALGLDRRRDVAWAFKLVCALLSAEREPQAPEATPAADSRAVTERRIARFRETELKPLQENVRELREEKRDLRKARRELSEQLERQNEELDQLHEAAAAVAPTIERLEEEVRDLKQSLDQELEARRAAERDLRKQARREEVLREQLAEISRELALVQKHELGLSGVLNKARWRIRELETELRVRIPTDEKVLAYLEGEAERIDAELLRLQGGPQREAERQKTLLKRLRDAFLEYRPQFRKPRPPVPLPPRPLCFHALGGGEEIGASAYVIEVGDHRILIDCGIRVGAELSNLGPDLDRLGAIDALVLTHAHTDHAGWIPALVRRLGEQGDFEIFATEETAKLLPIMLKDSRKHYVRLSGQAQLESKYIKDRGPVEEDYDDSDIEDALGRLRPVPLRQPVPLRGDVSFTLHRAGHVLGACSVLIEGGGRRAFLSGDFSDFFQKTVTSNAWPTAEIEGVDLLLLEATYGSRVHADLTEERARLVEEVHRIVAHGGVALIPCFALGRAQEVLAILAEESFPFPVWIDGMIQDINAVYRDAGQLSLPGNFRERRTGGWSLEEAIADARREPCAVVSTSGMLSGGPMVEYAAALLPDPKNCIFFCGYLDCDSPGGRLRDFSRLDVPERVVKIAREDGTEIWIKASRPAATFSLSAHADRNGLMAVVETLKPANVVLVHGDAEARASLAEALSRRSHRVHPSPTEFSIDCE